MDRVDFLGAEFTVGISIEIDSILKLEFFRAVTDSYNDALSLLHARFAAIPNQESYVRHTRLNLNSSREPKLEPDVPANFRRENSQDIGTTVNAASPNQLFLSPGQGRSTKS